jgi:class 3 adenylate cyclase
VFHATGRPADAPRAIDPVSTDVSNAPTETAYTGSPLEDPIQVKRRLAAIFAADVEGYSRLMGADEVATLDALTAHHVLEIDAEIRAALNDLRGIRTLD